jgi:hypothetical protein
MDTKNVTSRQKQVKLEFVSMRPKKQLLWQTLALPI